MSRSRKSEPPTCVVHKNPLEIAATRVKHEVTADFQIPDNEKIIEIWSSYNFDNLQLDIEVYSNNKNGVVRIASDEFLCNNMKMPYKKTDGYFEIPLGERHAFTEDCYLKLDYTFTEKRGVAKLQSKYHFQVCRPVCIIDKFNIRFPFSGSILQNRE